MTCFFGSIGTARADPVELVLRDDSFSISGTLIAFDGEIYQIQSEFGQLTFAADMVICRGSACPPLSAPLENIVFSGDSSLNSTLLMPLIQSFADHEGYSYQLSQDTAGQITLFDPENGTAHAVFTLSDRNSSDAILDILGDRAHFALTRRGATQKEQAALEKYMLGSLRHPQNSMVLAWQDLYLYSQPSNPNRFITMSQLVAMLEEKPRLWPLTAGRQYPVFLVGHADQTLALQQLLRIFDMAKQMPPKGVNIPGRLTVSTDQMPQNTFVQVGLGCGQQVMPTEIQAPAHPLQTPIYLIAAPKKMQNITRAFWAFLLTPGAQDAVRTLGFISRSLKKTEIHGQSGLLINAILNTDMDMRTKDLRQAVLKLNGYERMSLAFHFLEGTQIMDADSLSNLKFFKHLFMDGYFERRNIMFVGFSDSQGSADGNVQISLDRARAVRATIATLLEDAQLSNGFEVLGLGEGLPLACNDTAWGQNQNRRVEIWIK